MTGQNEQCERERRGSCLVHLSYGRTDHNGENKRQTGKFSHNPALISCSETEYVNEPYVTGVNPILADGDVAGRRNNSSENGYSIYGRVSHVCE